MKYTIEGFTGTKPLTVEKAVDEIRKALPLFEAVYAHINAKLLDLYGAWLVGDEPCWSDWIYSEEHRLQGSIEKIVENYYYRYVAPLKGVERKIALIHFNRIRELSKECWQRRTQTLKVLERY